MRARGEGYTRVPSWNFPDQYGGIATLPLPSREKLTRFSVRTSLISKVGLRLTIIIE